MDIEKLQLCNERYNSTLCTISCWTNDLGDYSYIRDKMCEFVIIQNNYDTIDYKMKLLRYIDSEIMMMNSLLLLNNMELF
jgi:hypothetical protein